jgi:hypothetical protein
MGNILWKTSCWPVGRVIFILMPGAFRKAGEKLETLPHGKPHDSNYNIPPQFDATFSDSHDANTSAKILATILQILKDIGTSDAW